MTDEAPTLAQVLAEAGQIARDGFDKAVATVHLDLALTAAEHLARLDLVAALLAEDPS